MTRTMTAWATVAILLSGPNLVAPVPAAAQQSPVTPVVRLAFPQDDGSLTPYTFELGYPLMTLVYDTLLWRDVDGVPKPWLATSADVSASGLEVTLRLADGVRWHDGTPVTAADVAFTFGFVADHPHPRFSAEVEAVARVDTPDPATVVLTLTHPSPGFADQPLADLPILPAHLWRNLRRGQAAPEGLPVGSGPYKLVEYLPGQSYRFEANPDYFKGPPQVRSIEVPVIREAEANLRALEQRQVDMVPLSLSRDLNARVDTLGTTAKKGTSYLGTVLMFNLRRPPFDQVEIRRAVSRTLDLRLLSRVVGEAEPANHGYLHPQSPWAPPESLHVVDEAGGRRVLSGLSVPPFDILTPANDPVRLEAARQVALALSRAGVRATPKPVQPDELSRAVGEDGSTPDFAAAIWGAPPLASYDPDFLRRVFGSGPTGAFNYSGYRNPVFDELASRIASTAEPGARKSEVAKALKLLADDAPVVPLLFPLGVFSYRPGIYDGWLFVKGTGILDKQSFLAHPEAPAPPSEGQDRQPVDDDGAPLGLVAAGLVALAVALAAFAVLRR